MRRVDGSHFHVRTAMAPITWRGDAAVMIVAHDITENRAIEAALNSERAAAELANMCLIEAVESIPEAFAVFTEDERLEFYNSNYVDVIWRHIRESVVPGWSEAVRRR